MASVLIFRGHTDSVSAVCFRRGECRLVTACSCDRHVCTWDAATGKCISDTEIESSLFPHAIAFSPLGDLCAFACDSAVHVRLTDDVGKVFKTLKNDVGDVEFLAFSPNGRLLASVPRLKRHSPAKIDLWDLETGKLVRMISHHDTHPAEAEEVACIAFTPDGTYLASGGSMNIVHFWDVATGEHVKGFSGCGGRVSAVSFSADGASLAIGGSNGIRVWDLGTCECVLSTGDRNGVPLNSNTSTMSFSPDGRSLAFGSGDGTLTILDIKTTKARVFGGHCKEISAVAFSSDGRKLAASCLDGTVQVRSVSGGTQALGSAAASVASVTFSVVLGLFVFFGSLVAFRYFGKRLARAYYGDDATCPLH